MYSILNEAIEDLASKLDDSKVETIVVVVTTKGVDDGFIASNGDGSLDNAHTVYHVLADAAIGMMDTCPVARVAKLADKLPSLQDLLGARDNEPPTI